MLRPFRVIATADSHWRADTPEELKYSLQELDDYALIAQSRGIRDVIIAGDIVHFKYKFPTELLLGMMACFEKHALAGIRFTLLQGNHDGPFAPNPDDTILKLFSGVANVVTTPMLVEEEDCVVLLMPWRPVHEYRPLLKHFASFAVGYSKPRILITHVSLQEGKVSPSNVRLSTPLRRVDLLPEVWTGGIFSGDYHAHQRFGPAGKREYYLGAARPRTFGDFDCLGVWELSANEFNLVALPSKYPAYISWRVDSLLDLPLKGYAASDHNRVYCPDQLRGIVLQHYPDAAIERTDVLQTGGGRLSSEVEPGKLKSPIEIAMQWADIKKLPPDYRSELRKVMQG